MKLSRRRVRRTTVAPPPPPEAAPDHGAFLGGDPTWALAIRAGRAFESHLERELATVGLSIAKYRVLSMLAHAKEPLGLCDLAGRIECGPSNVTQLIDRLEIEGFVKRVDDASDRRVVRAQLTPAGRQRYELGTKHLDTVRKGYPPLAARDVEAAKRIFAVMSTL
jgi:DNA-binding MarR family transcriptional regulator